ncbi:type III-A CRISPR-associated RAMP protein Csm3 [Spirulina sp. 06S082]|uniref:type III-A CRISPR-associated RAMP protein Csm3 n=1 Tax=Spirulina sp. 06S082 TaxID=3110248 RepID=UPI002B21A4B1|nr:type III-A CRISPR-associated RAMP protein Csm3 [Spirulina sp. 06S082]MEA5471208.1 type III-A CRISPR-associated RAMP protein Csm3 [Spirulina sp. 06S082]
MTLSTEQKPLLGKLRLTSSLVVETGLHIGGGGENLDIGGLDKPVIRNPLTQQPYIPGSSIKGKLRSILERLLNEPINRTGGSGTYRHECDSLKPWLLDVNSQSPHVGAADCPVCRIFGSTGKSQTLIQTSQGSKKVTGFNHPSRLIVRDCHLEKKSAEKLKQIDTSLYMTEWKFENGIDRVTSAANPRQLERVPAGAKFDFEMVYTVENKSQMQADLENLAIALAILEDDALGGHGSRGYGKIRFENFKAEYRSIDYYKSKISPTSGSLASASDEAMKDTSELLDRFGDIVGLLGGE